MLNTKQLKEAIKKLEIPGKRADYDTEEDYQDSLAVWRSQRGMLEGQWKEWLGNTYASSFNTKTQDLVFQQAWMEGHAYGYEEVENDYIDVAAFVDRLMDVM